MNDTTIKRPHRSPSQINMYCRCPEAYRRRYVEGEKIPPDIGLVRGTSFHHGVAANMRQKIESHEDLPAADFVDLSVAEYDTQTHGELRFVGDELSRKTQIIGEGRDMVAGLAQVHIHHQAPDYQPVLVEEAVRLQLSGPADLLGIIDLADDRRRVVDFKTAGKSKSQRDADNSLQLTVYSACYQARTGEPPTELALDVAVQLKTKSKRQYLPTARGPEHIAALAARLDTINAAIDAGIFPPTTEDNWACDPRYCGYHATCPYVHGGRHKTFVDLKTGD